MTGFGLGGFGVVEPWGSTGGLVAEPSIPVSTAQGDYQGILEAVSSAFGEQDTEIGGLYLTRLTSVVAEGTETFPVETTEDWGDTGKIAVDGVVYYYTGKTVSSFTGITHISGGVSVPGAIIDHRIESTVVDISRTRSALEKLRRAMLVDYAEGEDLDVIGRNLNVNRLPVLSGDDQFRELIKVLAYNPRGTVLGINLVLEALLGAGVAEVYEDLLEHPNVVFIKLPSASLISDSAAGSAYMPGHEYATLSGSSDTLVLPGGEPLGISSVRLASLGELFEFADEKPSASEYAYYPGATPSSAFDFDGTEAEAAGVLLTAGSHCQFTSATGGTAYYSMPDVKGARVVDKSFVEVTSLVRIPSTATLASGALKQCGVIIDDGAFRVHWGLEDDLTVGLFATVGGGFVGSTKQLTADIFHEITIKKHGDTSVDLLVDGVIIASVDYSQFTDATTDHEIQFGVIAGAVSGMKADFKQIGIQVETKPDYWGYQGYGSGDVLATSPNQFTLDRSGYSFVSSDEGKALRISGSAETNAQGGNNNGNWLIDTYTSSSVVELTGKEKDGVTVDTLTPTRITVVGDNDAFTFPDDLGKQIVITGSSGSNDGTYIISKLFQLGTLTDFSTFDSVVTESTNVCEVVSATFESEVDLTYKLMPNFVDETGLDWEQSDASSFFGDTITLRKEFWKNGLLFDVMPSRVLTGQVLDAESENELIDTDPNIYEYYPFYISDPFSLLKSYVDVITAAGVIPEYMID